MHDPQCAAGSRASVAARATARSADAVPSVPTTTSARAEDSVRSSMAASLVSRIYASSMVRMRRPAGKGRSP